MSGYLIYARCSAKYQAMHFWRSPFADCKHNEVEDWVLNFDYDRIQNGSSGTDRTQKEIYIKGNKMEVVLLKTINHFKHWSMDVPYFFTQPAGAGK